MIDQEQTSYRLTGDFVANAQTINLLSSFKNAMALDHKLPEAIANMQGMSGKKYRYLINNLVQRTPAARYLEIGSWAGSTACSASFGNALSITCIENWVNFYGPKDAFMENINSIMTPQIHFEFIENDFRAVNYSQIGQFNIYLYDGPHSENDQYDGVMIAQPALDEIFTLVVDDWNWPEVRRGTNRAIAESLEVICSLEIRTTQDDSHAQKAVQEHSEWHNGYFLAVCRKK
jgi:hypothetical protein